MAAFYLLVLMFLVLLVASLVLLLDPSVREFCKYIFPNIVLYFFVCPLIIFIAENALSFGGTILGVVGIFFLLGLFIFGVSLFDETDAQRAARLLDEADAHEHDAKHGGFIGAVTGENERNEALAYAKRAEARRLIFKEGLEIISVGKAGSRRGPGFNALEKVIAEGRKFLCDLAEPFGIVYIFLFMIAHLLSVSHRNHLCV